MTEAALLREIRAAINTATDAAGRLRARVVRNTCGYDAERKIRYGLGNGSADLVGILRGGRAFALEVKAPGRGARPEQAAWIRAFRRWGGAAFVVHSAGEAMAALAAAEAGNYLPADAAVC